MSYACLGVLFVGFAGIFVTKWCNIVHVNKLRVFLVVRCIKLWCFVFKSTLLFIYGRKWGESDKIYVKKCSLKHPLLLRKEIPAFYKCFLRTSFRIAQAIPYRQIVAWRSLPERFSSDICVFKVFCKRTLRYFRKKLGAFTDFLWVFCVFLRGFYYTSEKAQICIAAFICCFFQTSLRRWRVGCTCKSVGMLQLRDAHRQ